VGSNSYRTVVDNITEKIGGIKDLLDTINTEIVQDLIQQYVKIDQELATYNRSAGEDTEEGKK